jgi:phage gp29-like protein
MKLFDAYGRPVDTGLLKDEQAFPTLAGVRNIFSNLYPSTGLTPEKLTGILRQADFGDPFLFLEFAEEVEEKDTHYAAVLNKRKGAVSSLELLVQAASKDPREEGIANFVRDVLVNESALNLSEHLYDILDGIGKGFSATEIEWETDKRISSDVWWVPKALHWRDPRWFMFDWISGRAVLVRSLRTDGQIILGAEVESAKQRLEWVKGDGGQHLANRIKNWSWNSAAEKIGIQPLTAPLHPYKFIVHFGRAKSGLPIRCGLTRLIAFVYLFKNYARKDWASFVERYGLPIRLGVYDPGASGEDKQALLAAVGGLGSDMAGIIPKSMEVKFESPAGMTGSIDLYRTYLEYLDDLESKVVLGSTLGTETRGEGSRAASQTHRDVERDIEEADAKRLEATLNRDLVRPLVDLNFGPPKKPGGYPRLRIGLPDNDDVSAWVTNVTKLAESGMKIGVKNIYEKLHLTAPEDDEDVLTPPERVTVRDSTDQPPTGKPGEDKGPTAAFLRPSADPTSGARRA